ncbi:hypothetical protein [Clostridium sp. ZS2-4]|uniref:hypothetical protein n=1 Tax=Clostridium sp. ZS2-4 TaxID=2987703 RepID=UPI00227CB440|nr:hypothetical protein [Clostridium sp. ZS2-4]MCY6353913.1 hypothetical protein [Clostridium sp. ZS2-4]
MDIDKLKQKEDKKEIDNLLRMKLKTIAKSRFYNFNVICNKVTNNIKIKIKNKKQDFINQFIEYFRNKGFQMEIDNNIYIAKYKELSIVLINKEDAAFYFEIPSEKISCKIEIKEQSAFGNIIYGKDILRYNSEKLNVTNYEKIIDSIDKIEELQGLINKIEENINYHQKILDYFGIINYNYSIDKLPGIKCTTFKELFEIHINENK